MEARGRFQSLVKQRRRRGWGRPLTIIHRAADFINGVTFQFVENMTSDRLAKSASVVDTEVHGIDNYLFVTNTKLYL